MTDYSTILTEVRDRVGLVRLNRPQAMNALNGALMTELMQALEAFDAMSNIGAMVITGNERAFAAGADIKEMADASAVQMLLHDQIGQFDRIRRIHKPLIAAVSGWCLGGGNELALSCDMIVAAENARFGQPEITIGVIPGAGGTQRLTRAVGKAIAMEMVLNNRIADCRGSRPVWPGEPHRSAGTLPGRGAGARRGDRGARPVGSAAGQGSHQPGF